MPLAERSYDHAANYLLIFWPLISPNGNPHIEAGNQIRSATSETRRWAMATNHDVVDLYDDLCNGDSQAAAAVWEHYYDRLVKVARQKLNGAPCRAFDEEDVALSALRTFMAGAQKGRFYRWQSGGELWQLLLTITARKASAHQRWEMREKRGAGKVRGDSIFRSDHDTRSTPIGIQEIHGPEPCPAQLNMLLEEAEQLLGDLSDETLQRIARLRLAGYTNNEIAELLGCVPRTVERKLNRIRRKWQERATGAEVPCSRNGEKRSQKREGEAPAEPEPREVTAQQELRPPEFHL